MKDFMLGIALAVLTIIVLLVAFAQGFADEIDQVNAVAWPVIAMILLWMLVAPKIGKGGTR